MLEDFRLKIFMAVVESGSFTKAAISLAVSQPAVSQNIGALEKDLGVVLFDRLRAEAVLTPEGEAFKAYAAKILYWYSSARLMFGEEGRISQGTMVKILSDPVVADYLLPGMLSLLLSSHPELSFSVVSSDSDIPYIGQDRESQAQDANDSPSYSQDRPPEGADCYISLSPIKGQALIDDTRLAGVMEASAVVSSSSRLVGVADREGACPFSTPSGIPVRYRFAVWSGYKPFLTEDLVARTVLFSDSARTICDTTRKVPDIVGLVPGCAAADDITVGSLFPLPISMPEYSYDINYDPSAYFSGKSLSLQIYSIFRDFLSGK